MRKIAGIILIGASLIYAQRGGGDWTTSGNDAQRSAWLRSDPKISLSTLEKPGFQMIWKVKLGGTDLSDAMLLNFYIGYRGFRSLAFLGGVSNHVYAVDTDLSRVEWTKSLPGGASCSANAVPQLTRPTGLEIAMAGGARGGGRSAFARSSVGEPNEGAPNLKEVSMRRPPMPPPARPARGAGRGAVPNAFRRGPSYLYALTPDGKLHQMLVSNGEEPEPAFAFLPPNADARGLIVIDNIAYVITTKGCGNVAEGVWALNLEDKKVSSWKAPIAGSAGIAFDPEGNLFVATGAGGEHAASIVMLDYKTLKPKGWYSAGSAFTSSPVIFEYKDKVLAAAATADGRMHVVDTASLGGADHKTPVARSDAGAKVGGALATWEDSGHTRWILASTSNAIAAWKLADGNGAPAIESAWTSREMSTPLTPMILNDVVFALDGGKASTHAVLYALNPATGKELWNSGTDFAAAVPTGGMSAGGSQLYVGAADGTLYAFGFPMEH